MQWNELLALSLFWRFVAVCANERISKICLRNGTL